MGVSPEGAYTMKCEGREFDPPQEQSLCFYFQVQFYTMLRVIHKHQIYSLDDDPSREYVSAFQTRFYICKFVRPSALVVTVFVSLSGPLL